MLAVKSLLTLTLAAFVLSACPATRDAKTDIDCDWTQWGQGPAHTGHACAVGQSLKRSLASIVFDPFVEREKAAFRIQNQTDEGELTAHFQAPLLSGSDVYMEVKAGTYVDCDATSGDLTHCGQFAWNQQIWQERYYEWDHGSLVQRWTYASDWKPEPSTLSSWEPVFHPAISGPWLYVPGAHGGLHKLDRHSGEVVADILPFGKDVNAYVAGPLTIDKAGNVYFHVLQLPADPAQQDAKGFLVKVDAHDAVKKADFTSFVTGAPKSTDACYLGFSSKQTPRPWPPSPDAVPPQGPCGSQRPGLNIAPAVAKDGTILTVSRAHFNSEYAYVVALKPDLTTKWVASLRDLLFDGCGVLATCREGAKPGVDPSTNLAPAGRVIDESSSSPVTLEDGSVLYGAYTSYNDSRGHLFHFDAEGKHLKTFEFGWDVTPALYPHDGTVSILTKDNHYGVGPFNLSRLNSNLELEWSFTSTNNLSCHHTSNGEIVCGEDENHTSGGAHGFEWCVNAPAVDVEGVMFANSEDGRVYALNKDGTEREHLFLEQSLGAAYTPLSLDRAGRIYSLNGGLLTVVGN